MFPISIFARAAVGLGLTACAACAGFAPKSDESRAPQAFYTVTGELALARHEPRVAALQYASAAANDSDPALIERATEVAVETLQPSLAEKDAMRWIRVEPGSLDAQHAAARAEMALHRIEPAALHYRNVIVASPLGVEAEFAKLESELTADENIFGARQVADRLATFFPSSEAALRLRGFTALRADDPAAAVRSFTAALAFKSAAGQEGSGEEGSQRKAVPKSGEGSGQKEGAHREEDSRRELVQALARARILAGDFGPIEDARVTAERTDTPANRLDYALLLMTAQRDSAAIQQLELLRSNTEYAPVALRLLGLTEFQEGHFDVAAARFAELLRTDKFQDDAFYYLALIADRQDDAEDALRLFALVQTGDNALPALLRASALLYKHGAPTAAEALLDRLIEDEPRHAPEILDARARIYADAGDWAQAFAVLQRGILDYPDSVQLRYAMASTEEEQGKVTAALQELGDLARARPDDPAVLNALGYTLADHSVDLKRARKLIDRAYAAAPRNAAILDSLGWVLYRQGRGAEAENYLRIAYADDRGGDIGAHLGEVLWQLGKPIDADRIWSEAAVVDPDNRLLKMTRQRLHAAR